VEDQKPLGTLALIEIIRKDNLNWKNFSSGANRRAGFNLAPS
jgi:hypothetical protein